MLCDALSDAMGLARIRLQSIVASLRRKTSILFQIKQNDIGAASLGGGCTAVSPLTAPISIFVKQVSDQPHRHRRPRLRILDSDGDPSCLTSGSFVSFALPVNTPALGRLAIADAAWTWRFVPVALRVN